ncbi:MAG: WIAG-tail domain, partial [Paenibacillus sp.]|uniref:WIAG-tail domain n=1 Tax=Paenibacillus sp. TaxID=58172 RepID=UPI0025F5FA0D
DETVSTAHLQDGAVTASKLADSSVDGSKLTERAVTSMHLSEESVQSVHIAEGAIHADHIGDGSITSSHLSDETVSTAHLQDGVVTASKLADGSVDGSKLTEGTISSVHLADRAIDGSKLSEQSITSSHLNEGIVGTAHLSEEIWNAIRQVSAETLEQLAEFKRQEAMQEVQQFMHSVGLQNEGLFAWGDDAENSSENMLNDFEAGNLDLQKLLGLPNDIEAEEVLPEGESFTALTESEDVLDEVNALSSDATIPELTNHDASQFSNDETSTHLTLEPQSVTQEHLCEGSVGSEQLQSGAIQAKHLAFQPVRSVSKQPTVQQFGMEAFILPEQEICTEVTIVFEESFDSEHYVIVAMSNDRGFQVSLLSQSEDEAVLEVTRTADCKHTYGLLSWIAAGPSA